MFLFNCDFKDSNFKDGGIPDIAIWKLLYLRKYDRYPQNSNGKSKIFHHGGSNRVCLGDSNNDDNRLEMAAETGNTYISETVGDNIENPTANVGFFVG